MAPVKSPWWLQQCVTQFKRLQSLQQLCPEISGKSFCAQSASSRHKRTHSCSEKFTGQEIVGLPCKQTEGPEAGV